MLKAGAIPWTSAEPEWSWKCGISQMRNTMVWYCIVPSATAHNALIGSPFPTIPQWQRKVPTQMGLYIWSALCALSIEKQIVNCRRQFQIDFPMTNLLNLVLKITVVSWIIISGNGLAANRYSWTCDDPVNWHKYVSLGISVLILEGPCYLARCRWPRWLLVHYYINSYPPGQNGRHIADNSFRCIFVNENVCIMITISLKFVSERPTDNNPA